MTESDRSRRGRPRDPEIRSKVLLATQRVYLAGGLSGVTFEAVAREAGVGKPSVYRRWSSTDELMADVLRSHVLTPVAASADDIHGQLTEIAWSILSLLHSEAGSFVLRVLSERGSSEGIFDDYVGRIRDVIHSHNRALVVAAIERGELSRDCDPDILLQSITGAVLVGGLLGMADAGTDHEDATAYCRRVVDQILGGGRPRSGA